jgi:organic radical activating enzyme
MACLYCWDGFSSQIQSENNKFGRFEKHGVIIDNQSNPNSTKQVLTEKFWSWLEINHQSIKRFHVLGGEPFYQPQFDYCIDFFEQHPCPDLEFNVISNLKIKTNKLVTLLERIKNLVENKKIKRFDLTASIDCFGKEQEYVRYGINIDQWKKNFTLIAEQSWITVNINQTLSALTIKTVPELIEFVNKLRTQREIGHYFSTTVMTHDFLHPGIFGPGFFSADFDAILQVMPTETWQQKQAKEYMTGIKLQVDSCNRDDNKIYQLSVFLNEIDRRRQLDWKQTFPWLVKELKHVVQ